MSLAKVEFVFTKIPSWAFDIFSTKPSSCGTETFFWAMGKFFLYKTFVRWKLVYRKSYSSIKKKLCPGDLIFASINKSGKMQIFFQKKLFWGIAKCIFRQNWIPWDCEFFSIAHIRYLLEDPVGHWNFLYWKHAVLKVKIGKCFFSNNNSRGKIRFFFV